MVVGHLSPSHRVAAGLSVPPDLLARVSAYDIIGSVSAMPLGALLAGPIAAAIDELAFDLVPTDEPRAQPRRPTLQFLPGTCGDRNRVFGR